MTSGDHIAIGVLTIFLAGGDLGLFANFPRITNFDAFDDHVRSRFEIDLGLEIIHRQRLAGVVVYPQPPVSIHTVAIKAPGKRAFAACPVKIDVVIVGAVAVIVIVGVAADPIAKKCFL